MSGVVLSLAQFALFYPGATLTIARLIKRGYIPLSEVFKSISRTPDTNTLFSYAELLLRPRF